MRDTVAIKRSEETENMEDILTSHVFGTLKYLPNSSGLIQFLSKATFFNRETGDEDRPLGHLSQVLYRI